LLIGKVTAILVIRCQKLGHSNQPALQRSWDVPAAKVNWSCI
jgi:hypothetical protein